MKLLARECPFGDWQFCVPIATVAQGWPSAPRRRIWQRGVSRVVGPASNRGGRPGVREGVERLFTTWRMGIEHAAQRVVSLVCLLDIGILTGQLFRRSGDGADGLLVAVACVGVLGFLMLRTALGVAGRGDLVVAHVGLTLGVALTGLWNDARPGWDVDPAGPSLVACVALTSVIAHWPRTVWAMLPSAAIYAGGRWTSQGADSLLNSVDVLLIVIGPYLAIALLVRTYRRAALRADRAHTEAVRARREAARDQASRQALRDVRRVLHNDVIAALVAFRMTRDRDDAERVRAASARVLDLLDNFARHSAGDLRGLQVLEEVVDDLTLDVTVEVPPDFDERSVPAHAWRAVLSAAGEALRNVWRHAGVDRARVSIASGPTGGVVIRVIDEGVGFSASSPSFGITESIVADVRAVGGQVHITSAPGIGTTVQISWSGPSEETPLERSKRHSAHEAYELVRAASAGSVLRLTLGFAAVSVVGHLWLALRYADAGRDEGLGLLLAASTATFIGVLAVRVGRRPLGLGQHLVAGVMTWGLLALGLLLAGPGALAGLGSWIVGLATVALIVAALVTPLAPTVAVAAGASLVVLAAAVLDPALSPSDVPGPILQPLASAGIAGIAGYVIRRVSIAASQDEEELAERQADEAAFAVLDDAFRANLAELSAVLVPFLADVASGSADPLDSETQAEALSLAVEARDDLYLTGVLTGPAKESLREARRRGCRAVIRPGELRTDQHREAARELVEVLVRFAEPGRVITLSLPESSAQRLRLVIVGSVTEPELAALAAVAEGCGAEFVADEDLVVLTRHVPFVPLSSEEEGVGAHGRHGS